MARTAAGSRSGVDEYELHGHLSEKLFRAAGGYFANVSSSVGSISEESDSQQAGYLSYTSWLDNCDEVWLGLSRGSPIIRWKALRWESVALVGIHGPILAISAS
jgi:hypothetical protein